MNGNNFETTKLQCTWRGDEWEVVAARRGEAGAMSGSGERPAGVGRMGWGGGEKAFPNTRLRSCNRPCRNSLSTKCLAPHFPTHPEESHPSTERCGPLGPPLEELSTPVSGQISLFVVVLSLVCLFVLVSWFAIWILLIAFTINLSFRTSSDVLATS